MVFFSDIHLENWPNYNVRPFHRLEASLDILESLFKRAAQKQTHLYFCGDFFNTPLNIRNEVLYKSIEKLIYLFDKYPEVNIIGIPGNHDQCERQTYEHVSINYFSTLELIFKGRLINIDRKVILLNGGFQVAGIGYLYNDSGFDRIKSELEQQLIGNKKSILLIHTELPDATDVNGYETESIDIPKDIKNYFKKWDYVMCGHIHKHQFLQKNIIVVGATNQQRTSDMGAEFGYIELFNGEIKRKSLKAPKFLYGTPTNDSDMFIKEPEISENDIPEDLGDTFVPDGTKEKNTQMVRSYLDIVGISGIKKKIALDITRRIP